METIELGIVDTRNILKLLQEKHGYDFSDYALTAFKRRLERAMLITETRTVELFLNRIDRDKNFVENLLHEIQVDSTEMFRDPSLWRWLRDEFLPSQNYSTPYKIWIPEVVSGDELYTLAIVLKELNIQDKVRITVTSMSNQSLEFIKSGMLRSKKLDVSEENYKRFQGAKEFSLYYELQAGEIVRDPNLVRNVDFLQQSVIFDQTPGEVKLILFRNHLIYYNPTLQNRVLNHLVNSLMTGGHLILGNRESIEGFPRANELVMVNENENVFKKK